MSGEYRAGTNYNARNYHEADPHTQAVYRSARQQKCANGDHKIATVPATHAVYAAFGRRRETGDRYCIYCDVDLPAAMT